MCGVWCSVSYALPAKFESSPNLSAVIWRYPPSTGTSVPLMKEASSDARNNTTRATSTHSPQRFNI